MIQNLSGLLKKSGSLVMEKDGSETLTTGRLADWLFTRKGGWLGYPTQGDFILACLEGYKKKKDQTTPSMPLQERTEDINKALEALESNQYYISSHDRHDHCFYMILDGAGSGKTRLSDEISRSVAAKYPDNTYCIKINFKDEDRIYPELESKLPSYILGLRVAARLLFGCSTNELILYLYRNHSPVPFDAFAFDVVMELFCKWRTEVKKETGLANLVVVLDDVNYVPAAGRGVLGRILFLIKRYMVVSETDMHNPGYAHGLAVLPIISGTLLYSSLDSECTGAHCRWVFADVSPLSFEAMCNVFTSMYPQCQEWLKNKLFISTLKLYGTTPQCLECIMAACRDKTDQVNLTDEMAKEIAEESYSRMNAHFLCKINQSIIKSPLLAKLLRLLLSAQRITFDTFSAEERKQFEVEGLLFGQGFYKFMPYPLLRTLILQLPETIIKQHVLPVPGVPFYGHNVIELEAHLEISKKTEAPIKYLYDGTLMSGELWWHNMLELTDKAVRKENDLQGLNLMNAVVLCDDNPLVDIKSVYYSPKNQRKVMFVKHITDTMWWRNVIHWKNDAEALMAPWKEEYDIVYVLIATEWVHRLLPPESREWPSDLIIVHHRCPYYYGPTVHQIVSSLTDL